MVGALDVVGLLGVVELLVLVLPLPGPFELRSPVGLVDMLEPRGRIGPLGLRGLPAPIGLPRPDGLRNDVIPDDTPVESDEDEVDEGAVTDETEPAGAVGEQLTPGVMMGDGLWVPVDLVGVVDVDVDDVGEVDDVGDVGDAVEFVPVVPVPPVVCANAGAVLKAIAHARPAPLRIGIFRILIEMFVKVLVKMILLQCHLRSIAIPSAIDASLNRIDASHLPISLLRPRFLSLSSEL